MPNPSVLDVLNRGARNSEVLTNDASGKFCFGKHFFNPDDFISVQRSAPTESLRTFRSARFFMSESADQSVYRTICDRKTFGNFLWPDTLFVQAKNLPNICIGKFCICITGAFLNWVKSRVIRVLDVLSTSNPFKIFKSIVGLDTVNVIYFVLLRWSRAEKGECDNLMNEKPSIGAAWARKTYRPVSRAVFGWIQNPIGVAMWRASKPFDSSIRADHVNPFPPWDITPLLFHEP